MKRVAALLLCFVLGACGGAHAASRAAGFGRPGVRVTGEGRPPLAVVAREGDARGALAVAVSTAGIASERGAVVAVALAALVEARMAARGVADITAVGGWDGWRLRGLVGTPVEATRWVDAAQAAMLTPVTAQEAAWSAVLRKTAALSRRPLADRALVDVVQCTGEAYGLPGDNGVTVAEVEAWRQKANGLGRVAFGSAGNGDVIAAAAAALRRGSAWPSASTAFPLVPPEGDSRTTQYDASGAIEPGTARIVATARTSIPERAVAAASALGDAHGPLASRLAGLDAPARVHTVVATAHVDGGCVAVTLDMAARDLGDDAAPRIATAAALVRQELAVELADTLTPADLARVLPMQASDPRDAAERAAWWSLAGSQARTAKTEGTRLALTVGVATRRDGSAPTAELLRAELDRATMAWHAPVVESRTHVERGQGETWVLVASPCGTLAETAADAGASAAVAMAAAAQANDKADARVEPFVSADGVGVVAHGPARANESPAAQARRLADLAARAFAADGLDDEWIGRARTTLLALATDTEWRAFAALGSALAAEHPSWLQPFGTRFGLASSSNDAISARAAALRAGPLRVAVLANASPAQADAAVRAVDRWIARRPRELRACPVPAPLTARPGTYAVETALGSPSEAWLALPIGPADPTLRTDARWLAAVLDGPDGLLLRALGSGSDGTARDPPLVSFASATMLGDPLAPALVVRLVAPEASLDGAVAQTRALLERVRLGALRQEDRDRAAARVARANLTASLDPRLRTIDLWRGAAAGPSPSLEALRAFAAMVLHDDALVIVAARPPRLDASGRPYTARDSKVKNRDPEEAR